MSASLTSLRAPKQHPIWGHGLELHRDQIGFVSRLAAEYGDVVPLWVMPYRVVFFNRPDLVEEVLATKQRHFVKSIVLRRLGELLGDGILVSDGDYYRRQRRLVQPAFHRDRVDGYGRVMVDHTERMLDGWRDGEERELQAEMMRLTLGVVCDALFNADVAGEAGEVGQAFTAALRAVQDRTSSIQIVLPGFVPLPARVRLWRATRRLDRMVYRIIREHRTAGGSGDLVSMLLAARDEETGRGMSDRQVRDEMMTIVLAGHETTALALTWGWYLLAQHPEVEARLHDEVTQVLGDRLPTVADMARLPYTGMVISEALRFYPPAWALVREAVADVEIGGYPLRKGAVVLISPWTMHRDPRYFERPEAFMPERWADGLAKRLPRFAYFPFGGGQRQCIGTGFAMMELTLIFATMVRRFRLRLVPGQQIGYMPAITVRATPGIRMVVQAR